MGQEIVYCWKCNIRILGAEFEKGKAVQLGNRASCSKCAPELIAGLTPQERQAWQAKTAKPSPVTPRAFPRTSSSVSIRAIPDKPGGSKVALAAGLGAGGVVILAVLVVMLSGGEPAPPPAPRSPVPVPKASSAPPSSPKEKSAREAVAKAKALPAGDVEAKIRAYQEAVFAAEGTTVFEEANRELRSLIAKRAATVDVEFRQLDEASRVPLRLDEYGKAIEILEGAKGRRDETGWRLRIDERVHEVKKAARAAFDPLKARALDAKQRGAEAELKQIEEKVARWGLPELLEELKGAAKAAPTPGTYKQSADADGLVVIEAERFSSAKAMSGTEWVPATGPEGAAGMRAMPDQGSKFESKYERQAPELEYKIAFVKAGKHYLWWRGWSAGPSGDSFHAGFNGQRVPELENLKIGSSSTLRWESKPGSGKASSASFEVDKPGTHKLQIWVREDGVAIDRLLITTNPAYVPGGAGPPESPR